MAPTRPRPGTGLRVVSGGTADLTGATLQDGVKCVENAGTLTLSNTTFADCGLIAGPDSVSYAENGTDSVATYAATHPATGARLSAATWSVAGPDRSAFQNPGEYGRRHPLLPQRPQL